MTAKTSAELLDEAAAVIRERLADVAARNLPEWDGPVHYLVIDAGDAEAREALAYIAEHGQQAGVKAMKPVSADEVKAMLRQQRQAS
jgi:hypothetical protein